MADDFDRDMKEYIASRKKSTLFGNVLKEKLEDLGFISTEDAHKPFDGAKLLRIEDNGRIVAPYVDHYSYIKDCGDYLEITYSYPDYVFNETTGYIECEATGYIECETTYECSCCGAEVGEDDVISVDGVPYCENCTFFCAHFEEHMVGETYKVFYSMHRSYTVCEDALNDMGAVYNEEENEWQTAEWFAECTKEDEEDTEIENEPKKEIKVGDKCVVIGGHITFHYFPLGTTVQTSGVYKDTFYCVWGTVGQYIKESDLVVTE